MEKYISYLSYIIFDGKSYWAVPGKFVDEALAENLEHAVVDRPYTDAEVDYIVDTLNADIKAQIRK